MQLKHPFNDSQSQVQDEEQFNAIEAQPENETEEPLIEIEENVNESASIIHYIDIID